MIPARDNALGSVLRRSASLALLWAILSDARADGLVLGAVAVAATTWASLRLLPSTGLRLAGLPGFLAFFVWNSLRGGIQVAAMALRGRAALRPTLLELTLALPAGPARVLVTGTLGLMPGTLAVALDGERLRLHVLDARLPVAAEARALEACIARLFWSAS